MAKKTSLKHSSRQIALIVGVAVVVVVVILGLVQATQNTNLDNRPKAGFAVRGF